jgi:hypothetical protein
MAIQVKETKDRRTLEVTVTGRLAHEDYEQFVPEFERLLQRHGKLRILFEMVDFHGWEASAWWDDVKFDLKHSKHIERLAMVGEKRWEKVMTSFCRPFLRARLRYFDREEARKARAWLEAS